MFFQIDKQTLIHHLLNHLTRCVIAPRLFTDTLNRILFQIWIEFCQQVLKYQTQQLRI